MTAHAPLAIDGDGNPLDVPESAVAWRVRRGSGKRGRPRTVFDADTGLQLEIPLESTIDELIDRGCAPDRYRLEAIDADGRVIPGVVAIVEVADDEEPDTDEKPATVSNDNFARMSQLVERLVDANCRTMEAMASAFGTVRPTQLAPITVEPAPSANTMRPDQLIETIAKVGTAFVEAWKETKGTGGTP